MPNNKKDKTTMPICPYCKARMRAMKYKGYYDEFDFWDCDCTITEKGIPSENKKITRGQYA